MPMPVVDASALAFLEQRMKQLENDVKTGEQARAEYERARAEYQQDKRSRAEYDQAREKYEQARAEYAQKLQTTDTKWQQQLDTERARLQQEQQQQIARIEQTWTQTWTERLGQLEATLGQYKNMQEAVTVLNQNYDKLRQMLSTQQETLQTQMNLKDDQQSAQRELQQRVNGLEDEQKRVQSEWTNAKEQREENKRILNKLDLANVKHMDLERKLRDLEAKPILQIEPNEIFQAKAAIDAVKQEMTALYELTKQDAQEHLASTERVVEDGKRGVKLYVTAFESRMSHLQQHLESQLRRVEDVQARLAASADPSSATKYDCADQNMFPSSPAPHSGSQKSSDAKDTLDQTMVQYKSGRQSTTPTPRPFVQQSFSQEPLPSILRGPQTPYLPLLNQNIVPVGRPRQRWNASPARLPVRSLPPESEPSTVAANPVQFVPPPSPTPIGTSSPSVSTGMREPGAAGPGKASSPGPTDFAKAFLEPRQVGDASL